MGDVCPAWKSGPEVTVRRGDFIEHEHRTSNFEKNLLYNVSWKECDRILNNKDGKVLPQAERRPWRADFRRLIVRNTGNQENDFARTADEETAKAVLWVILPIHRAKATVLLLLNQNLL